MSRLAPAQVLRDPVLLLATGLGAGLAPRAPGTFGTLVAVPLWALLAPLPPALYGAVTAAVVLAGIPLCGAAARRLGLHDHPAIVWDEIAGYLLAMAFVPASAAAAAAGFVLFRLLDILKPWPVCVLDRRLGGGLGIMADDVAAGVLAGSGLWLAAPYLPPWG
ncbi:phosphatidylglycerophosphatase A family protein [Inmirania thermothiophila]|uniref:Phosphatidylglycerophosphatase A n=1 Tax=Inmirania thermothiophila TaxID=1750597 RepID=A0A3N1Y886_9GAMM|nr:phosphatidylglycerophosphatase A [Inmirania thermothiophila]ROR34970.1 phosphatidylglycerophosphatase A [Inmirania thermothiophila]